MASISRSNVPRSVSTFRHARCSKQSCAARAGSDSRRDDHFWDEAAVLAVGPLVRSWRLSRRAVHTGRMRAHDPNQRWSVAVATAFHRASRF
jgi:hypothetical protein